jgi:uncharacterized protein Veg
MFDFYFFLLTECYTSYFLVDFHEDNDKRKKKKKLAFKAYQPLYPKRV